MLISPSEKLRFRLSSFCTCFQILRSSDLSKMSRNSMDFLSDSLWVAGPGLGAAWFWPEAACRKVARA